MNNLVSKLKKLQNGKNGEESHKTKEIPMKNIVKEGAYNYFLEGINDDHKKPDPDLEKILNILKTYCVILKEIDKNDDIHDLLEFNSKPGNIFDVDEQLFSNSKSAARVINSAKKFVCVKLEEKKEEKGYLLFGVNHEFYALQSAHIFNILKRLASLVDFVLHLEIDQIQITTTENFAAKLTDFIVVLAKNIENIFLIRCKILMVKKFKCPCTTDKSELTDKEYSERHIMITYSKDDFLKTTFKDSESQVDLYTFSFMIDFMIEELVKYVDRRSDFLDISNYLFSGKHIGFVLESETNNIIHFHFNHRLDIKSFIDLNYLSMNRNDLSHFQLNKIVKNEKILEEILEQLCHASFYDSEVKVIEREFYKIVYLNIDLPMMNPSENTVEISSESKKNNLGDIFRKRVKGLAHKKSIMNQLRQVRSKGNIFQAFRPGMTKVKKNKVIVNSGLGAFLELKMDLLYKNLKDQDYIKTAKKLKREHEEKLEKALATKRVYKVSSESVDKITQDINVWNIVIFNKPKEYLANFACRIFREMGYLEKHNIQYILFSHFISDLCLYYSYNQNPYHNFTHANNVLHCFYYFITQTKLSDMIDDRTKFAGLIGALGHDVGHRGMNNGYEVNSLSLVAMRYHDRSVLEQYHIGILMDILYQDKSNILKSLNYDEYRDTRKTIIDCILATDMSKHKPLLQEFEDNMEIYKNKDKPLEKDEQNKIASIFTHMCDLNGSAKKFDIYMKWSNQVRQEFIQQVQAEKANNLPVTPFMIGLEKETKYLKGEMFFTKCILLHLFEIGNRFLDGELNDILDTVKDNAKECERLYQKAQEEEDEEAK